MDAYILAKTVVYLFLSINSPTTLYFDEPIEFVQAGKSGEISVVRSSNKKILVIQPLLKIEEERNMVVITKSHHFNFKFKLNTFGHHDFLYIHPGATNRAYKVKFENSIVRILEGETSTYIQNKTKDRIKINGMDMDRSLYFSKGLPIFLNGERVIY